MRRASGITSGITSRDSGSPVSPRGMLPSFEDAESDCYDIINRTNNRLERYNRRFNNLFESGKKPPLLTFVNTVEEKSRFQAQLINDIRENRRREVDRDLPTVPQVPMAYYRLVDCRIVLS